MGKWTFRGMFSPPEKVSLALTALPLIPIHHTSPSLFLSVSLCAALSDCQDAAAAAGHSAAARGRPLGRPHGDVEGDGEGEGVSRAADPGVASAAEEKAGGGGF